MRASPDIRRRRIGPDRVFARTRLIQQRSSAMTLGTLLVIILILILIGAIPNWGYSRGWGYGPSGIVGVVLVVVLVLLLMGRI
jgi:Na+/melibiose symporter-like transporter